MENHTPHTDHRPLGFWLRAVDGLVTREFAAAFEGEPADRRDWMILNALDRTADAALSDAMRERIARRPKRIVRLAELGWIAATDGSWTLTDEGRAAKERLREKVDAVRERVASAVPEEDFATTLRTLEAIAHEFGGDEGALRFGVRGRRRGHRWGGPFDGRHDGHERVHGHGHEHDFGPHRDHMHGHGRHGVGPHLRHAC